MFKRGDSLAFLSVLVKPSSSLLGDVVNVATTCTTADNVSHSLVEVAFVLEMLEGRVQS